MEKRNKTSAYSEAVNSGTYQKELGLIKKYDNVRIYWEDEISRTFVRPYLENLISEKEDRLGRLRILDLGCGSGDGFELLKGVRRKDNNLTTQGIYAIGPEALGLYLGIDNNAELIEQARAVHGQNPKLEFVHADFSNLVNTLSGYEKFDLFFSSYGTMSHCSDDQFVDLILQVMELSGPRAIAVCDWLGRYTYAWQDLWSDDLSTSQFMDYRISYIYPDEVRDKLELESFPLRLMSAPEVERLVDRINAKGKKKVRLLKLSDRSVFVSRHMDTGDYNKRSQQIRRQINSLHEDFMRTPLEELIIDFYPKSGFQEVNSYLEKLQICWNALVKHTMFLLDNYDRESESCDVDKEIPEYYPIPVKRGMGEMKKLIQGTGWIQNGDVRANIIEPHLGYALRQLEFEMQKGMGVGHGLVAVLEITE
jgi:SAM-dependent methyltransferase